MKKRQRRSPARVRYILKDKSEKETLIYLTIRVNTKRVKWSTREKVDPKIWNSKTRRAIVRAGSRSAQFLNLKLDRYAKHALEIFAEWELDIPAGLREFNQDKFKTELDYRTGIQARPDESGGVDTSDFIRFCESVRDLRKDSPDISTQTWKNINANVNLFREYADRKYNGQVNFAEVDALFVEGLKKFLFRVKNHKPQTVFKAMAILRNMASRAADRELMVYDQRFKKWTKQEFRKRPQPALNRHELGKVIRLQLDDERLARVRDLFLIGVATAQRWSDFSQLTPANFEQLPNGGYRYYIPTQRKTKSPAGGPVFSWAVPILKRYGYIGDGDFDPPKISGQKFNDYIKEVMKIAIPDATFTVYNDGEKVDHVGQQVPKWSEIASHTARRSAVSLLRTMKVPDNQILKMTGHKTITEMDGYDVRDAETLALDLGKDLDRAWSRGGMRVAE